MSRSGRSTLYFDAYHLPGDVDLLYRGSDVVPLEPRAASLLRYLATHNERVVPKSELLEQVWADVFTTDGVLKKAISQIRRALKDDAGESRFIETYHARGYRFIAPVRRVDPAAKRRDTLPPLSMPNPPSAMIPSYEQFKGRDAQLAELCAHFESARKGNPRPVVISGESGIGKTQLARHFRRWVRGAGATTLYGRFLDYRGARAGGELFVDLLAAALGPAANVLEEIEKRCGIALPADVFALSSPASDRFRYIVPIARAWLALARSAPLVLVLDDLQWADEASLDILGCIMRMLESEPLMLLLLVRPEEERSNAVQSWLEEHAVQRTYATLQLGGLDETTCRDVIGSVFQARRSGELPPRDIERLHQLTGGNPYFLIEILRELVAEKAVVANQDQRRWIWKGIDNLTLPPSIVLASRARVERLSAAVLDLLEQASVFGDEFRVDALASVAGLPHAEVDSLLEEAREAGILTIRNVSRGEDCRFQHSIQRHVLYTSIAPHRKRRLHAAAAEAISTIHAENPDRIAGALSVHYAGAEEPRKTLEWSLRAWRLAARRWEWRKASVFAGRARDAAADAAPTDAERVELLLVTGETCLAAGQNRDAVGVLREAASAADACGDRAATARALMREGEAQIGLSDYHSARISFISALDLYHAVGDEAGASRAVLQLAGVENARGACASAAELATKVLSGDPDDAARQEARAILGWSLALRGGFAEGRRLLDQALDLCERAGDIRSRATILRRLHWIDLCRGDYEAAIQLAARARSDSIAIGDALGETKANLGIGQARIAQGLFEEGIAIVNRTLERLQVIGDAHCEAEALWLLGRARCESGDLEQAASLIPRALAMVRRIGDRDDECRILIDLSRLEVVRGNLVVALEAAKSAHAIAEELANCEASALAQLQLACVELASGNAAVGVKKAEIAVHLLEQIGSSERWRGYSILGLGRRIAGDRAAARVALQRSLDLVDAVRDQIPAADTQRRMTISRNRATPARELASLLDADGLGDEARRLTKHWDY